MKNLIKYFWLSVLIAGFVTLFQINSANAQCSPCPPIPGEANSCGDATTIFQISSSGNVIGGCFDGGVVDFYRVKVGNKFYIIRADQVSATGCGIYLLDVKVQNGRLKVTNLSSIDVAIGFYNSSCNPIGTTAVNNNSIRILVKPAIINSTGVILP